MKKAAGLVFLLAFFLGLWSGALDEQHSEALPEKLLRLRVVAADDSEAAQARKLLARDTALQVLLPLLEGCDSLASAEQAVASALPATAEAIALALGETGEAPPLTLTLGPAACPLRSYEDFTLPAGTYETLTVTLGAGEGRNWWCVVFPPLCLAAAEGEPEENDSWAVFSPDERSMMTAEGRELRFRLLEIFQNLRDLFRSKKDPSI